MRFIVCMFFRAGFFGTAHSIDFGFSVCPLEIAFEECYDKLIRFDLHSQY